MPARIAHFEIQGPNDEQTAAFYRDLLDWPTDARGPGYTLIDDAAVGLGGAIAETAESRVVLGVTVPDLVGTIARVAELGGEVLMPPTDNGWVTKAVVADPDRNQLSLIAEKPAGGR
jgi:predicted enzyme related to lactoylglutathione lyase